MFTWFKIYKKLYMINNTNSKFGVKHSAIGEEVKIAVNLSLRHFKAAENRKELEFPSSFTAEERKYIHTLACEMGFKSKSRGKGSNRRLTVYKKDDIPVNAVKASIGLLNESQQLIASLLQKYPFSNKEKQDLKFIRDRVNISEDNCRIFGRLNAGIPLIPPYSCQSDYSKSLPIWEYKMQILEHIHNNQVVLIVGATGCGKTTQVPQFLLNEHCEMKKPCRIVCAQSRRIAALSVAERVAIERGERLGYTVGYQIRLESRVSPKTLLTYCTHGILLRALSVGEYSSSALTHILVDEIHERDRFADMLLATLRDRLRQCRSLRLILLSAAMDVSLLTSYFPGCSVIHIPTRLFSIKEVYLGEVLKMTDYLSQKFISYFDQQQEGKKKISSLSASEETHNSECTHNYPLNNYDNKQSENYLKDENGKSLLSTTLKVQADAILTDIFLTGNLEAFMKLLHLIQNAGLPVNYQHSETLATALMVCSGRGLIFCLEQLLVMGADVNLRACNGWTALEWAQQLQQNEAEEFLKSYIGILLNEFKEDEDVELLNAYLNSVDDNHIDLDLILILLEKICATTEEGSILVFLPGYEEIIKLREMATLQLSHVVILSLHSNLATCEQKKVFSPPPVGHRKIILSTNIAETSITIEDVTYVIDTGRFKENVFDSLNGATSLCLAWISKASAQQRSGRAGRCRPGVCYRLYTRKRLQSFLTFQTAEILRSPIHDLCLHVKVLTPNGCSIVDFLSKLPEPPAPAVCRRAVQLLHLQDALDATEELTELGCHMLDLSLSPRLAKSILYAVILKCLDPVLTIVCCLQGRDIFTLPSSGGSIAQIRKMDWIARHRLSAGTFSDHMALLRAFQAWQKACADGWERSFCEKHFICGAAMEMVAGIRGQLLGQLRALGFIRARGGGDIRDLNSNSENWAVVKAALFAGAYPNVIFYDKEKKQLKTKYVLIIKHLEIIIYKIRQERVRFHPSCVLTEIHQSCQSDSTTLPTNWLFYEDLCKTGRIIHVRQCTLVTPVIVALFAGPSKLSPNTFENLQYLSSSLSTNGNDLYSDSEQDEASNAISEYPEAKIYIDEFIQLYCHPEISQILLNLRQKFHALFIRRLRFPSKPWSQLDEIVIKTIVNVLSYEEMASGLPQPSGVGQRPRPLMTDYHSRVGNGKEFIEYQEDTHLFTQTPNSIQHEEIKLNDYLESEEKDSHVQKQAGHEYRYFIIKCISQAQVNASFSLGIWAFSASTERKLMKVLHSKFETKICLIFSAQGSGQLLGYAILTGEPASGVSPEHLGYPHGICYYIEWVQCRGLPFHYTRHLLNPYNDNRKVQSSRDGQELEPNVGEALCRMWAQDPSASVLEQTSESDLHSQFISSSNQIGRPIRGYNHQQNSFPNGREWPV